MIRTDGLNGIANTTWVEDTQMIKDRYKDGWTFADLKEDGDKESTE